MNFQKYYKTRPKLYHLTHKSNVRNIISEGIIYSTTYIVDNTKEVDNSFLTSRRDRLETISFNGNDIVIRDQLPLNPNLLPRAMDGTCTPNEYIKIINDRVFFWPTKVRLMRHYDTYAAEEPLILVFDANQIFQLNRDRVELCKYNSGALRCHPTYNGNPPPRGIDTFMSLQVYNQTPSTVAEFTVIEYCTLPDTFSILESPNGQTIPMDNYIP